MRRMFAGQLNDQLSWVPVPDGLNAGAGQRSVELDLRRWSTTLILMTSLA
ncbi:MAG: hypothetical protein R3E79_00475 [Caldilineaceae bacterium]